MTTEDDFQRQLDADPDDHQTRLVLADWLQDRDDPRADGYRALARTNSRPGPWTLDGYRTTPDAAAVWRWWNDVDVDNNSDDLHRFWFDLLEGGRDAREYSRVYPTRRAAEDAAAVAFLKLSAARREALLAAPPGP